MTSHEIEARFARPWSLWRAIREWWRDRPRRKWIAEAYGDMMVCPTRALAVKWIVLWISANGDAPDANERIRPGGWWRPSEIAGLEHHEDGWLTGPPKDTQRSIVT